MARLFGYLNELMLYQLILIYMYTLNLSKFSTVCFTVFLVIFTNTRLSRHRGSQLLHNSSNNYSRHVCQGNQNKDAYVLLFCYTSGQVGKLVPEPVYMYRMCLCVTKSLTTFCVTYVLISVYIFFIISPCSKPSLLDCNYPNYMK